jgi:Hsp70 protein
VVVHRDSESISSLFIVCSQPISSSHLSPSYFQVSDLVKADEKTRIRITSIVKSLVPVSTVAKPPALLSIDTDVFDVLAAMDNTRLPGGDDFDNRVIDHLIKLYKKKTGTDVKYQQSTCTREAYPFGKLKPEVEKAKRTLSSQRSTRIGIESLQDSNDFSETLIRPYCTPS